MQVVGIQIRTKADHVKILAAIGAVKHGRFASLGALLKQGLSQGMIYLQCWLRLAGWLNTGGTYKSATPRVRTLCLLLLGYEIPKTINSVNLKECRYKRISDAMKLEIETYHGAHVW